MFFYLIFCLSLSVFAHTTVEIDNEVLGEPEVRCESDSISLLFHTKNPFLGKIFVKGFVSDDNCVSMGDNRNDHRFTVSHDGCGVRRMREVNGVVITSTVIVSFHSIFITKVDRAYRLSCLYVESTKKVKQQLDIASLTTEMLNGQTQLPVCRYEILSDGPSGVPVKYARVGEVVYHKWTCVSELEDVYCMRVHSCTVYDGQGGPPVTVLDVNGCSVDGILLQNLDYMSDLTAGKSAQVFKFADKTGLYYNCQIRLSVKDPQFGCSAAQPPCSQTYVEPSSRTTEISSSDYAGVHESGYPTRAATYVEDAKTTTTTTTTTTGMYDAPEEPFNTSSLLEEELAAATYPTQNETEQGSGAAYAGETGPPGAEPTYSDLHDYNDYTEQNVSFQQPYSGPSTRGYSRLIKREVKGLPNERRIPVSIADFDLPEKGLIVFEIEDDAEHDFSNALASSKFLADERVAKTCFTTNKLFTFFVIITILLSSLAFSLGLIWYRQRRVITESLFKH